MLNGSDMSYKLHNWKLDEEKKNGTQVRYTLRVGQNARHPDGREYTNTITKDITLEEAVSFVNRMLFTDPDLIYASVDKYADGVLRSTVHFK
jgi:hypothetical protein